MYTYGINAFRTPAMIIFRKWNGKAQQNRERKYAPWYTHEQFLLVVTHKNVTSCLNRRESVGDGDGTMVKNAASQALDRAQE